MRITLKTSSVTILGILISIMLIMSCGSSLKGLIEPESDTSVLAIGGIILENLGYNERFEIYIDEIEVALLGKVIDNGKEKTLGLWTKTDESGYFCFSNLQPGKYALKGIRFILTSGELLTISNTLDFTGSNFLLQRPENNLIIFDGTHFAHELDGRIINLGINYFAIDRQSPFNRRVRHEEKDEFLDFTSHNGVSMQFPRSEKHYIEKYPTSAWVPLLQERLK